MQRLLPIFHNPNVKISMRILTVSEVRHITGLSDILANHKHNINKKREIKKAGHKLGHKVGNKVGDKVGNKVGHKV